MDHQTLTIPTQPTPTSTKANQEPLSTHLYYIEVGIRLIAVFALAGIASWANLEASKTFDIKVINGAKHTQQGKKFQLMFISNGYAERLIQNSSRFVENILFSENIHDRKPVHTVTLYFSAHNLANNSSVITSAHNRGEFIMTLSPALMSVPALEVENAVAAALLLGVAQVWLWNGNGKTPRPLTSAMTKFLTQSSGIRTPHWECGVLKIKQNSTCWDEDDDVAVAQFLKYCEDRNLGFVARLNAAMQESFDEGMIDKALGIPARSMCSAFVSSMKLEEVINLYEGVNYE